MKKLLGILASVALTTVPVGTLTNFSTEDNSVQNKESEESKQWIDPLGAIVENFKLTETKKDELLKDTDKTKLHDEILAALNKANDGAIINDDTFVFSLNQVTPETQKLWVNVKATLASTDKKGLNAKTVEVKLGLIAKDQDQISPVQDITVSLQLNETKKTDEVLTENDQTRLEKTVLQSLMKANRAAANVSEKTFDLGDLTKLAPTTTEINATVQATNSTADKPGLTAGSVKVTLNLTPANLDRVAAQEVSVENFKLTETHLGETLKKNDQDALHQTILDTLNKANENTVHDENTFEIGDLSKLTSASQTTSVNVKPTFSTTEKEGLIAGKANVKLTFIPANLDPIAAAKDTQFQLNLDETKYKQKLSDKDQTKLRQAILDALKAANAKAVCDDSTFDVASLDLTQITTDTTSIEKIKVNATKSTAEKPGLLAGNVDVHFALTPANQDSVPAQGASVENFKLTETHLGDDTLTTNDRDALQKEIIAALMKTNENANVQPSIFTIKMDDIKLTTSEEQTIKVAVAATDSTIEKPGLSKGSVDVQLTLIFANPDPIAAKGANVSVDLQETHLGQTLTENDQKTVRQAILDALKTINAKAVCDDNTFDVASLDLSQLTPETANQIYVKVNPTESTPEKPGLIEDTVTVYLALTPLS